MKRFIGRTFRRIQEEPPRRKACLVLRRPAPMELKRRPFSAKGGRDLGGAHYQTAASVNEEMKSKRENNSRGASRRDASSRRSLIARSAANFSSQLPQG